jgi:hypothetical protein
MEADRFDPEDPADEALDRLLAQARWERPSVASTQRLRRHWIRLSRRDVMLRIGLTFAAAAAVAIVVGSCALWLRMQREPRTRPPIFLSIHTEPQVTQKPPPPPVVIGKPLTAELKLAMLVADGASRSPRPPLPQASPEPPRLDLSHLLVDVRSPSADRRKAALREMLSRGDAASVAAYLTCLREEPLRDESLAALHALHKPPIDALIAHLDSPLVENRMAAAEALGEVCDAAVASRLAAMVQSNTNRREALAALLSARSAEAADSLAHAGAQNPVVRAQIQALRSELSALY